MAKLNDSRNPSVATINSLKRDNAARRVANPARVADVSCNVPTRAGDVEAPLILYCYVADRYEFRQERPFEAMLKLRRAGYRVQTVALDKSDLSAYSKTLRGFWHIDRTLISVEHDVIMTAEQIDDLVNCPYPACAYAYWLAPATTGKTHPVLSATNALGIVNYNDSWADYSGIGAIKVAESARDLEIDVCPYWDVENTVNKAVKPFTSHKWHLHWPVVEHIHGFRKDHR